MGGKLYFQAATTTTGGELFVYDPVDGACIVADINSGTGSSYPQMLDIGSNRFTVMGEKLFFTAENGTDDYELYTLEPGGVPVYTGDMNPTGEFVWTD